MHELIAGHQGSFAVCRAGTRGASLTGCHAGVQIAQLGEAAEPMRQVLILVKGILVARGLCGSHLGLPSVALSLVGLARVPRLALRRPAGLPPGADRCGDCILVWSSLHHTERAVLLSCARRLPACTSASSRGEPSRSFNPRTSGALQRGRWPGSTRRRVCRPASDATTPRQAHRAMRGWLVWGFLGGRRRPDERHQPTPPPAALPGAPGN